VLFVAVTAEEVGLIGSDYFARNPTVPRDAMVANVNMDGLPLLYDFADVIAYGFEHSTIAAPVRRAAERLHLEITPDPFPEQVFFVRSDHYSFVKQGVPAIFATEGMKAADPAVDGRALFDAWMATHYHRPNDDLQQPLNFTAATKGAKFQFLIGYNIASDADVPRWNQGDFFGDRFGQRRE
jgi:Zn-dependent M28 family amino/carboxypeptidase